MIPEASPLLLLALVIVGGLLAGHAARRLRMASVTGQILLGILLGHSGLQVFDHADMDQLAPVTHFALGLIAVTVGGHLSLRRLRGARLRLGLLLVLETTLTPLLVYLAAVLLVGAPWPIGLLLAALAIETAPVTTVALIDEMRARGIFTKTLVGAVALNNIACIAMFEAAHLAARAALLGGAGGDLAEALLVPLRQLALAAGLGGLMGLGLVMLTRRRVRSTQLASASFVGVLLAVGLSEALGLSPLLTCLFLGVTLANLTPDKDEIVESAFVSFREAIFAVFFTLAGMHLDVKALLLAGPLALAVFLARAVGKLVSARAALTVAGATESVRRHLGPALLPQAGVSVGLLMVVADDPVMQPLVAPLLAVGLAVVAANELVGPFLQRHALVATGDAGQDRDRILEFLHEESIVTGLQAASQAEAIEQLVDVLIRSNRLDADRDRLLASVLDREAEASTCFGEGLAVPHGLLEHGERIVGAMGLSATALPFDGPDGRPVQCVVVLATPPKQRDRHLQVLAALAKAIGSDANRRRQLFAARTPAHAYELLHAHEAQDFNWFLEDHADHDATA